MTASPSSATVLFVDDEPNVTDALKRALRREPYEFLTATSGAAALKILEGQYVDVVVSDEQMPGLSGSVFLSMVRKQYPHTIRIILSGQASLEAAVRAINEGQVHRFFLKPCNPTDLAFTIQHALSYKRLEEKCRRLLREYQRQAAVLAKFNQELLNGDTGAAGAAPATNDSDDEKEVTDLLAEIERAIQGR